MALLMAAHLANGEKLNYLGCLDFIDYRIMTAFFFGKLAH